MNIKNGSRVKITNLKGTGIKSKTGLIGCVVDVLEVTNGIMLPLKVQFKNTNVYYLSYDNVEVV